MIAAIKNAGPPIMGALVGAALLLGALKVVLQVTANRQQLDWLGGTFWFGASAIAIYVSALITLLATTLLLVAAAAVTKEGVLPQAVLITGLALGCLTGVIIAGYVILRGEIFHYDGTDPNTRGLVALLGLAVLIGGAWLWRALTPAAAHLRG